jgi:hypothetical protein
MTHLICLRTARQTRVERGRGGGEQRTNLL